MDTTDDIRLLNAVAVAHALGISVARVYVLVKEQRLPPPLKLGSRKSRWLASDVHQYLDTLRPAPDATKGTTPCSIHSKPS